MSHFEDPYCTPSCAWYTGHMFKAPPRYQENEWKWRIPHMTQDNEYDLPSPSTEAGMDSDYKQNLHMFIDKKSCVSTCPNLTQVLVERHVREKAEDPFPSFLSSWKPKKRPVTGERRPPGAQGQTPGASAVGPAIVPWHQLFDVLGAVVASIALRFRYSGCCLL